MNCCVPFAGTSQAREGVRSSLGVKQQEGEFSVLGMAEVIYHIESATQTGENEVACSDSGEGEKPLPNKAAVKLFGLQKAHGGM